MTHFRIISDIHGKEFIYRRLVRGDKNLNIPPSTYTLQLGDLGFNYQEIYDGIDKEKHKFFGGNHDNYDIINKSPHCLGDFGIHTVPEFGDIFFVRGAWSIDLKYRKEGISWWKDEELNYQKCEEAIQLYEKLKPEFVVTHEAPWRVLPFLNLNPQFAIDCGWDSSYIKTRTNMMFERMLEIHLPRWWIFGHYHQNFVEEIDGTIFICIQHEEYLDFGKGFEERFIIAE